MAGQINITLHFRGGPLDGASRQQLIPAHWSVVRYEHRPRVDTATAHVYSGYRQPTDREVRLEYIGAERAESAT